MKEEFSFDPMTGERIVKKAEAPKEEVSFDPMTGERIVKRAEAPKEEVSFDPMTGERIVKRAEAPKEEVSFDPMTGERIVRKAEAPKEQVSFDPMTGERIYGQAASGMGNKAAKATGKISGKVIGIAGGAVAVILVGACLIKSGIFMGKTDKVLTAATNTFATAEFAELETAAEILANDKFSVDITGDIMNQEVSATYSQTGSQNSLAFSADISGVGDVNGNAVLDDKELKFNVPFISDYVFTYNYVNEKDGAIAELEDGEIVEALDWSLKMIREGKDNKATKDFRKDVTRQLRDLKFKKVSKETYEVNGKDRKCTGYETVLTEDVVLEYVDLLEDYYSELYKDCGVDDIQDSMDDMLDDIRDELEFDEDIVVTCYLYSNRLAAVRMEIDKDAVEFQINNTKNPIEKMTLRVESGSSEKEAVWEGKESGSKMEYTLDVDDLGEVMEVSYDKKSGEVSIEIEDDFVLEGTVDKKGGKVIYTITELEIDSTKVDGEFSVTVSDKAGKVSVKGDKFDIGNASEADLEDLVEDLEDELSSALGGLY